MKVAFYTLGCKLNQAETESLVNDFVRAGFEIVPSDAAADIYIANTCTVTHIADRKSRQWLRACRRRNPEGLVVAVGCYAQRDHRGLAGLADLVVGNQEKGNLVALTSTLLIEGGARSSGRTEPCDVLPDVRVRSLVKIQDGCHRSCIYCIVPRVRPHEYSLPALRIIDGIQQRVARDYREIVLTGTEIGSYHSDGVILEDLVRCILHDTRIERLRLSSLQPSDISSGFLALWEDARLCRHFHLALQSGSGAVLRRMGRAYSVDDYRRAVDLIRHTMPEASITTDVIVGFPGESDEEFEQSYAFCRQCAFANIHVFPFSPRPGTAAAAMSEQIADRVKQERNRRMLELSQSTRRCFCERFMGQTMQVLWEKETSPGSGIYSGLTGNYIRVFARSERRLSNEITPATLLEVGARGVRADVRQLTGHR